MTMANVSSSGKIKLEWGYMCTRCGQQPHPSHWLFFLTEEDAIKFAADYGLTPRGPENELGYRIVNADVQTPVQE